MRQKRIILIVLFLAIFLCSCGTNFNDSAGGGTTETPTPAPTPTTVSVSLSSAAIGSGGNTTVTATVTDASSVVVPNVTVSFSVISLTTGSFSPVSAVTNASGVATSTFTAGASVNALATIQATVAVGTGTISGSASITIGTPPQVPTSIVVTLGSTSILSSGNTTVSATVRDAAGALMSGVNVTFAVSDATAGSFTAGTASTTAGVAKDIFTANAVDNVVTITATVGTLNNSASLTIGNPTLTPASMTISSTPLSLNIQGQSTVSATLLTSTGAPAYNNTVTFTITSGTALGSFSAAVSQLTITAVTNASGIASTTFYAGTSSGVVNIQGSATGVPSQNVSINITSAPASLTVGATNPGLQSGQNTNISATVRNILNNPVTDGTTVTFTISAGATNAGSLSSATGTTVNGVASVTFTASLVNNGSLVIMATAGSASGTVLITVSAAAAQSIEFVTATPQVIGISGSGVASSSLVTFIAKDTNGSPRSGVSVAFTLYGPSGSSLAAPSGSTGSDGTVSANLQAGTVAGPARIVATVTLPSGATISTSSGNISIGGGVPSDRWFSVAVSKFNLDGLTCNNVQSTLTAYIADRFGNYNILQGTSVSFSTDAGAIDTSNVTNALGITNSVYRTQDPRPTDVAPAAWETAAGLFYTDGTGTIRNPRDGYISILVSTTGEEYFQDENADGLFTSSLNATACPLGFTCTCVGGGLIIPSDGTRTCSGNRSEAFANLPEPFLDSNDNGQPDAGELFFDWQGGATGVPGATAGVYNYPNSVWDSRIPVFRNVNLVYTGPPNFGPNTSRIESDSAGSGPVTLPVGGSEVFYVYVSDINLNTPIAGTNISLASDDSAAKITLIGGSTTIADGLSTGPSVLTYVVKNTTTSALPIYPTLLATYNWPGTCGAINTTISYAGLVTLRPVAPAAPSMTATAGSAGTGVIILQWPPVTGATSYNIYSGTAPGPVTLIPGVTTSPNSFTGVPGTTYYFAMTASNSGGTSPKSSEVSAVAP